MNNPIPPPNGPWTLAVVSTTDDDSRRFAILSENKPIMRTESDTVDDAANAMLATAAPTMLHALYSAQVELENTALAFGERSVALTKVEDAINLAIWSGEGEVDSGEED